MNRAERRATFDALLRDVCERPAHSSPELRREASGRTTLAGAVGRLVDHIRQRATLVTDADVEAARAEGLDDDQLYELTVATSLGESGRRLDAVARALKGDAK